MMNVEKWKTYETIKVHLQGSVCYIEINQPTINNQLVVEFHEVLSMCEESATIIVLSGATEVFCLGADFKAIAGAAKNSYEWGNSPEQLYDLWLSLATGPYISIAHVRGRANAGGVGFIAASDIVIAEEAAQFSLSELLFGLYPACVLPFLIRRVGFQNAHYLTLMTWPISAKQAFEMRLVDSYEPNSEALLRRHLQRLQRISKTAIRRYKNYLSRISIPLQELKSLAVADNLEIFSDAENLRAVTRYVEMGIFPWEKA